MNTILIIFLCIFSVHGFNDTIERKERGAGAAPAGDLVIQRITTSLGNINQLFWWEQEDFLLCADSKADISYRWTYNTGKITERYLEAISGENFAFNIPMDNEKYKGIIGSDDTLRIISFDNKREKFNISEPVFMFKEKGYKVHTAHCDSRGTMYVVINYKLFSKDENKGSIMYRFKNMRPEKIKEFYTTVVDFVFTNDNKKIFVLRDMGETIEQFDFNIGWGTFRNPKQIYNITENSKGMNCKMTSLEIDKENNLWVTTDDSYILRIASNGTLTKIIETPFCGLTDITFGGFNNKNLLVATKKECAPMELQAGSVLVIAGANYSGVADIPVLWK